MTRRVVAVCATLLLTGIGCSGDGDASTPTTAALITSPTTATSTSAVTTAPTSTAAPTTAAISTPVTDPPTTPPGTTDPGTTEPSTTVATGDPDWLEIIQGLSDVYDELQREPDAERISEFCAPGPNECLDVQGTAIQQFADEGWHAENFPSTPIVSAVLSATAGDAPVEQSPFVIVLVTSGDVDFTDARVVDGAGDLVFDLVSEGKSGQANWLLNRDSAGSWKVASIGSIP